MKVETWVAVVLPLTIVLGCGSELLGCTGNGERLREQILHQRDADADAGLFTSRTVNPCNMNSAELEQLRTKNPDRVAEYADACQRMANEGCRI